MIQCRNCETAQFLQIVESHIGFPSEGESEIYELSETYECTLCGSHGAYDFNTRDGIRVSGDVRETGDNPVMSA